MRYRLFGGLRCSDKRSLPNIFELKSFCFRERGLLAYFVVITLIYLIFASFGISTSSIGIVSENGLPHPNVLSGQPLDIRADEYLRASPTLIGSLVNGNSDNVLSLFDVTSGEQFKAGQDSFLQRFLANVSLPHDILIRELPLAMAFSALWWKFTWYLMLAFPLIFRLIGLKWSVGAIGAFVIWSLPINQWWSIWPTVYVGSFALALSLLLLAVKIGTKIRSPYLRTFLTMGLVLSAALIAYPMAFSYQLWSFPVAVFFLFFGIFCSCVIYEKKIKTHLLMVTTLFLSLVGSAVFIVYQAQQEIIASISNSVYPGERKSFGFDTMPLFSGPATWNLFQEKFAVMNQSELAGGAFYALIPTVFFAVAIFGSSFFDNREKIMVAGSLLSLVPIILWIAVPWPHALANSIPYLTVMSTGRSVQVLGMLAVIPFFVVLNYFQKMTDSKLRSHVLTLVIILGVSWVLIARDIAFWNLNNAVLISESVIWLLAFLAAISITVPAITGRKNLTLIPLLLLSFYISSNVNPFMRGLGIFNESTTSQLISDSRKIEDSGFAFDNNLADTFLLAGGAKQISGQQANGPNEKIWRLLDPNESKKEVWNKGGAYVTFRWTTSPEISIDAPTARELIVISVNPCNDALDPLDIGWIGSLGGLGEYPCLVYQGQAPLQGTQLVLYKRN